MPVTIRVQGKDAIAWINRVKAALEGNKQDTMLRGVAWSSLGRLVADTPKGFTGKTRQDWKVIAVRGRGYIVTNVSKVMRWLEEGTKAHGPVRAKMLYIPLNRGAAIGGWHSSLVIGVDYRLAKKVKGIQAMHIVRSERRIVEDALRQGMINFLRDIL